MGAHSLCWFCHVAAHLEDSFYNLQGKRETGLYWDAKIGKSLDSTQSGRISASFDLYPCFSHQCIVHVHLFENIKLRFLVLQNASKLIILPGSCITSVLYFKLDKPGRLPDTGFPVIQNGSKVNDMIWFLSYIYS